MKPNGTVHLSDIPELAREWDFEKNISDLTPDKITVGSNRIVWWRCAKGHSWKDAVVKRTHGKPCPYCTNRRVLIGYNDLATLYPKLANEWDYSNNVGVDINTVVPGCTKKVSWKCSSCGHTWVASIRSRTRKCVVEMSSMRLFMESKSWQPDTWSRLSTVLKSSFSQRCKRLGNVQSSTCC